MTLVPDLFFNKFGGARLQLYLKRDSGTGVFCEFCEIFKNTFLTEQLWWLLLSISLIGLLLEIFFGTVLKMLQVAATLLQ